MSLEQIRAFLEASHEVQFEGRNREDVYGWVGQTLRHQGYEELGRASRGLVRRYLERMTGLSRAQITRLIGRWNQTRQVQPLAPQRPSFPRRYRSVDIALLAQVDAAHEDLSGPAIRRILQREYAVYGKAEF